jgi:transposase
MAELLECGLLHGSFSPSAEQKEVRDLTRYRMKTVQARTSEIQRLHKALESAGIKLGSVLTDITGVSARLMVDALIDGERRAQVLADLAKGTLRSAGKQADLSMALTARFTEHHAMLCRLHRDQIKLADHAIAGLDAQIADRAGRWPRELGLLGSVPGFGGRGVRGLASRDRPRSAPVVPLARQARLVGDLVPGEQHQRPQA